MKEFIGELEFLGENLVHFTSASTLKNILDNNEIWLSDFIFLNERSEGNYFDKLLNEILEKEFYNTDFKKEIISQLNTFENNYNIYIFSLSDEKDNISLWNNYGTDDRYSINFNKENLNLIISNYLDKIQIENKIKKYIFNVEYNKEKQLEILNKIFYKIYKKNKIINSDLEIILYLKTIFKEHYHHVENEKRFIILIPKNLDIYSEFRIQEGIFIPYIKIHSENLRKSILEITIGPLTKNENSKIGLEKYLKKLNLNIKISKSKINLRF